MRGFLNDKLPGGLFKRDFFISLALFLLAIVTRVPFTEHFFGHPDGPEYAIAIERFLPREGFPYPLTFTYVMLIRLINFIVNNAHTSILTQSVIGTGLLVIIVYWLGLTIFDRTKGIWAALIVLSAPWFWYYGITYFPFMFTGFFSGASALGFYYAVFKKNKYGLYWGTVSFAMLCGYRHPEFMFTAPLYLWALLNTRPKDALRSLLLFTLVCLLWFIPEVIMYGGFREFIGIFQNFSKSSKMTRNIFTVPFNEIKTNFTIKVKILLLIYGIGNVPLIYQLQPFFNLTNIFSDRRVRFFLIWMMPAVIFWSIFFGEIPGYFMPVVIALSIYSTWAIAATSKEISDLAKKFNWGVRLLIKPDNLSWVFILFLVITNSVTFLYDFHPIRKAQLETEYLSYPEVRKKDLMLANKLKYIKKNFSPQNTVIITTYWYFMQAMYYLPGYHIYNFDVVEFGKHRKIMQYGFSHHRIRTIQEENTFIFKSDTARVVFFDEEFKDYISDISKVKEVEIGAGYHLFILSGSPGKRIKFSFQRVDFGG